MRRAWILCMMVLLSVSLATGCASFTALWEKPPARTLVQKARASFDKVKATGAESKAPFEYYAAEAYLEQAQHELQEDDFEAAKTFAAESEKYSAQALEKAKGGAK